MTSTLKFAALFVVIVVIAVVSAFHSSSHKMFPATAGPLLLRAPREPSKELFPCRCFSTVKNVWFQLCKVPDPFNLQDTGTLIGAPYFVKCDIDRTIVNEAKDKLKRKLREDLQGISAAKMSIAYRRFKSDLGAVGATSNTSELIVAKQSLELAKLFADGCGETEDNPLLVCIPQVNTQKTGTVSHLEAKKRPSKITTARFQLELISKTVTDTFGDEIKEYRGDFLQVHDIPRQIFRKRYGRIPKYIYIRDCYQKLYDIVSENMRTYATSEESPVTLFTGVPGIGKSVFLIYFIHRFLQDDRFVDKRFAIEFKSGSYHYFRPGNVPGELYYSKKTADSLPVVPIFSDISLQVEPECRGKWLCIFSSPNPNRYKEIMKNDPNFRYTLPTWSYSELKTFEPDERKWIKRFYLHGGVARILFSVKSDKVLEAELDKVLREKGGLIADYFFRHSYGNIDSETTFRIIHINPPWSQELNDWDYGGPETCSFASDEILKRIFEKHINSTLAVAKDRFNSGVASEIYGGGTAGYIFEKICLWIDPIAGKTITVRELEFPFETFNITLPTMQLLDDHWKQKNASYRDPSKELQPNIQYQPRVSNLESGDAFCMVPWGVDEKDGLETFAIVVLQITVGETHPVKMNGLTEIIQAYPQAIQDRIRKYLFVFVTPKNGKLNTIQPYHTQENTVARAIRSPVKEFKQYAYRHVI